MKDWKAYEIVVSRKEVSKPREKIESPKVAAQLFAEFAEESTQESMFIIVVGGRNNMLGIQQLYVGTATGTSVAVGEMFRACIDGRSGDCDCSQSPKRRCPAIGRGHQTNEGRSCGFALA